MAVRGPNRWLLAETLAPPIAKGQTSSQTPQENHPARPYCLTQAEMLASIPHSEGRGSPVGSHPVGPAPLQSDYPGRPRQSISRPSKFEPHRPTAIQRNLHDALNLLANFAARHHESQNAVRQEAKPMANELEAAYLLRVMTRFQLPEEEAVALWHAPTD